MTTRRSLLLGLVGAIGAAASPVRFALGGRAPGDRRLVVVVLRGGLDGLAALVPYGDPAYEAARGALALPPPGQEGGPVPLDGTFALHPSLAPWTSLYGAGELLPVHAAATPYRSRSHFDGQDVLEGGTGKARQRRDGWLNRALVASGVDGDSAGLALSPVVPHLLRGEAGVGSTSLDRGEELPPELLDHLAGLYAVDPLLGPALSRGLGSREAVEAAIRSTSGGRRRGAGAACGVLGRLLRDDDAPTVAVLELSGWDTHARQGTTGGVLANRLRDLAGGVVALKEAMGSTWSKTVVLVVTEFGRTVMANGTFGTDHGTGGAAFVVGGAVAGGRVLADWPGIGSKALYEGRDLRPTTDLRSVFKGVLHDHLGVTRSSLERDVFPGSAAASPTRGLIG